MQDSTILGAWALNQIPASVANAISRGGTLSGRVTLGCVYSGLRKWHPRELPDACPWLVLHWLAFDARDAARLALRAWANRECEERGILRASFWSADYTDPQCVAHWPVFETWLVLRALLGMPLTAGDFGV